jgi:hypothetical protein
MRSLISSLEQSEPQNFTRLTEFLLDFGFSARTELADRLTHFASPKNKAESLTFTATDRLVVFLRDATSRKA